MQTSSSFFWISKPQKPLQISCAAQESLEKATFKASVKINAAAFNCVWKCLNIFFFPNMTTTCQCNNFHAFTCKTAYETFKVYLNIKRPWALEKKPPLHFNHSFMPRAKPVFWLCWYSAKEQQSHQQSWGGLLVCHFISADCIYYLWKWYQVRGYEKVIDVHLCW